MAKAAIVSVVDSFRIALLLLWAWLWLPPLKDAEEGGATGMNGQDVHSRAAGDRMSPRTDDIKQRVTRAVA